MERYYSHFNSDTPELTNGLKQFIIKANQYLLGLADDENYHPSQTRGKSPYSKVTFRDNLWSFEGVRRRGDSLLLDKIMVRFFGQDVWRLTRSGKYIANSDLVKENIRHCLQEALKNYEPDLPWCGPSQFTDAQTGLVYKAIYTGTDLNFLIREAVYSHGAPVWEAICEGGYIN